MIKKTREIILMKKMLGCRSDGVKAYYCENLCEIRRCALGNGFETCGECSELNGCQTVRAIHDNSDEAAKNLQGEQ